MKKLLTTLFICLALSALHSSAQQAKIKSTSCGSFHTLLLQTNGKLWASGGNSHGQLGDGTNISKSSPNQIGTESNWSLVYGGINNSIAKKLDGSLYACGAGTGINGNGTTNIQFSFSQIGTENNWLDVQYNYFHALALKNNGTLWAWGYNNSFRLGDGTNITRLSPVQIGLDNDWQKISTGGAYSIALKSNNSLYTWGFANLGALGNGGGAIVTVPTALGTCTLANENFTKTQITLYPNPTKTMLNITTTTPLQKTIIYNLLGAKVYEQAFNEIVDVSSLSSGVYVVKFYGEDNVVFVEKIVKE